MKKLFILSSLIILLLSCDKEDRLQFLNISGTISDKIDNTPIQGAYIAIVMGDFVPPDVIDTALISDVNGKFKCEIIPVDDSPYYLSIENIGYKPVNLNIDRSKRNNEFNIKLERF